MTPAGIRIQPGCFAPLHRLAAQPPRRDETLSQQCTYDLQVCDHQIETPLRPWRRRHPIPDGYVFFNRQPIIMEIGRPIMMI